MRRTIHVLVLALTLTVLLASAALAAPNWPGRIPLPDGFQPEGIVSGNGTTFYVGSLANGAIFQGDYRTGEGDLFVTGDAGRIAVGMSFDRSSGYLFVAGGPTGTARVYDTRSGELVASYAFAGAGFVNDVIVTRTAAYFTDSAQPQLYVVPLGKNGLPADPSEVITLPLTGEWQQVQGFNANGIEATPNGKELIVVNSARGALFRVDPATGVATRINLGGAVLTNGDGLLLQGKTLYVVQNRLNQIAVVELAPNLASGQVVNTLTDPDFRVPTTVASHGNTLYAVNARFGTPPGPNVDYDVVKVDGEDAP
jgi:sugar lactone lactonase YvrE